MASAWSVSTIPKDTTFTYNWSIHEFSKALKRSRTMEPLCSEIFKIPGLPWDFRIHVQKLMLDIDSDDGPNEVVRPQAVVMAENILDISSFFCVKLCVENPEISGDELLELKLAGTLAISESNDGIVRNVLKGTILEFEAYSDDVEYILRPIANVSILDADIKDGNSQYDQTEPIKGWVFGNKNLMLVRGRSQEGVECEQKFYHGFYTRGETPKLDLKAVITVPSQIRTVSGGVWKVEAKNFSFEEHLSRPDYSDITLVCGEKRFQCHKLLLANK